MSLKPVIYCGANDQELELLERLCEELQCKIAVCDFDTLLEQIASEWDQVVILDLDCFPQPIDTLHKLKSVNAGVPLLVIASRRKLPLTTTAVMRGNGVDALFWKPIGQWEEIYDAMEAAFRRIKSWQESIRIIKEYEASQMERALVGLSNNSSQTVSRSMPNDSANEHNLFLSP